MSPTDKGVDSSRWEIVQDLLAEAMDLDAGDRPEFLDQSCHGDTELRSEVESLISASAESDAYFDDLASRAGITLSTDTREASSVGGRRVAEPEEDLVGQKVGQYKILQWLGQGGMAAVYLAEREGEGFTQRVALKLVSKRVSDPLIQRRSNEERRILARLEHRSIARLIDGGITPEGHPFYAMEYVDGMDVLQYCDDHRLRIKQRLELFLEVCAPVQFAHERLVVHCDLKPSNIFVTDDGHVKLLDFGVARLIDPDSAGDNETGLWFTPAYASPEQIRRERPGTHSDVYSLGVLLYEILTGRRPYRFDSPRQEDVARTVAEVVPPLPSMVVTQPSTTSDRGRQVETSPAGTSAARSSTPQRMQKRLRGDLDAIVMKALAKDPGDRYGTAEQLAADVRRHLTHRQVTAAPATLRYRTAKFVRRNRAGVLAATLVLMTLVTGMGTTLWQASRAATSAAAAQDEAEKAELVAALMTDMFRLSDPSETLGDTITARDLLDRGADRILAEFGDQPVVQAGLLSEVASVYSSLGLFSRAAPLIENALRLREAEFGGTSIQVSESLIQLGETRADQGEQSEAIELLSQAIDLREPLVTFPDELLVEAKGSLGWLVRSSRQYDRAAELFSEALDGAAILEPGGGLEAELLFGLASTFHDSGQFDQADSVFAVVLAEYDATSRPSPTVISALTNVALIRRLRGQFHEAEPLARAAVDVATALYGSEHNDVFVTKTDLGLVLYWTGDWQEAEPMLRDAIEGSSEILGPLHPTTAGLQEALGALLVGMGEYDEAAGLHKLSLQEKIRRLGDVDHPGIVASLVRVAEALAGAGHFEEAREYIARSEAMNRRLGAVPSIYSISSEQSLGNITWRERDLEAAEQHFQAAIALADELLSRPDHRYQWLLKYDYGAFLNGTGRAAEAVSILEWVLASQIERLGEPHPMVDKTRSALQEARAG